MMSISASFMNSLKEYLQFRKRILESLIDEFRKKYVSLDALRKRVNRDGVPEDDHTLWDDLIMWENLEAELNKIKDFLRELETCSTK